MRRFGVLVLAAAVLLAGCDSATTARPTGVRLESAPALDPDLLIRWHMWVTSGVDMDGDPKQPHRDHCAADQVSGLWFVEQPSAPGNAEYACTVPAGPGLFVVVGTATGAERDLPCQVVAGGDLTIDDVGHHTSMMGPVSILTGSLATKAAAASIPPMYACAQAAVVAPLPAGTHRIVMRNHIVDDATTTVTVTVLP